MAGQQAAAVSASRGTGPGSSETQRSAVASGNVPDCNRGHRG